MDDKETKEFSWTAILLVTGFSFFFFSKILQWLDGTPLPVFTWIGIIAVLLGSLNSIVSLKEKSEKK
jgi:predicted ABC-type exoprotein transport system permease subunit